MRMHLRKYGSLRSMSGPWRSPTLDRLKEPSKLRPRSIRKVGNGAEVFVTFLAVGQDLTVFIRRIDSS